MPTYCEALAKDLKRLEGELDAIAKVLAKDPKNAKALAERGKIAPFLTKAALEKRYDLAKKMDFESMGKAIKSAGLPF